MMSYHIEDRRGYRGYIGSAADLLEIKQWLFRVAQITATRAGQFEVVGDDRLAASARAGAEAIGEIVEQGGTARLGPAAWAVLTFGPEAGGYRADERNKAFLAPVVGRFTDALQICEVYIAIK